jgi:hypothetical protein
MVDKLMISENSYFCKKYITMEQSAFIDINLLPVEARKELEAFYEFLLFKHKKKGGIKTTNKNNRFDKFLSNPIKVDSFDMFSREERNER